MADAFAVLGGCVIHATPALIDIKHSGGPSSFVDEHQAGRAHEARDCTQGSQGD
jgi:hypothetical protein